MATSSFLEDAKNQTPTATNNDKTTNNHPFSWMNTWIIYCPMITNTTIQNGKIIKRHKLLNKIAYVSIMLMCIFFWAWDVVIEFHDYGVNLFTLVWGTSISLVNISKLISVYYFYNYFKFYGIPSAHNNENDIEMQNQEMHSSGSDLTVPKYHRLTKRFRIRMKVILVLVIIILLLINISSSIQLLYEPNKSIGLLIYAIIYKFFTIYFYDIPFFLAQFVLSVYYCEGCVFVKRLTEILDKSINIDFEQITKEYSLYRNEYKKKIKWLERFIMLRLCALISFLWINIAAISEAKTWLEVMDDSLWILLYVFPFFEMIMSGNPATKKFHYFHKKLYSVGTQKYFFTDSVSDAAVRHSNLQYLFLLDYVAAFPFLIKIFAKEVSFKNAAKIIVAFAVAKIISYLFKHKLV